MTKKQLHEEHTRLVTDFRQPRLKVTVKPYSYSHFRSLVEKDYTQKDIETITSMYVMQQLQDSVVVDMPAPAISKPRWKFR